MKCVIDHQSLGPIVFAEKFILTLIAAFRNQPRRERNRERIDIERVGADGGAAFILDIESQGRILLPRPDGSGHAAHGVARAVLSVCGVEGISIANELAHLIVDFHELEVRPELLVRQGISILG